MGNSISKPRYIDGVSMGADAVGGWINIRGVSDVSFQAVWTGDAVGPFVVEVSNDGNANIKGEAPSLNLGATALTLTAAQQAAFPAGSGSNFLFEFRQMAVSWIRFWFDRSSGTGTLKVGMTGKSP